MEFKDEYNRIYKYMCNLHKDRSQLASELLSLILNYDYKDEYKGVYRDIYNLHEKYHRTSTETNWGLLLKECVEIADKHNEDEFVGKFLHVVIDEIERQGNK